MVGNSYDEKREMEQGLEHRCPFCREPVPETKEEADQNLMKRVKANDPVAMVDIGYSLCKEGDYDSAFEYWTKAAELGNAESHHYLSIMYRNGHGAEKCEGKEVYHLEQAAIGGHPDARHDLGCYEENRGGFKRAVKHFIIGAKLGYEDSMKALWFFKYMAISPKRN